MDKEFSPKEKQQLDMMLEDLIEEGERDSQGRVILDFVEVNKRVNATLGPDGNLQRLVAEVINTVEDIDRRKEKE